MDYSTYTTWKEWITAGLFALVTVLVMWWADKRDRQ
jgi:hypothetical protein